MEKNIKPIFEIGDYVQHKDPEKRNAMKLEGRIIDMGVGNNGTVPFYFMNGHGTWALLLENQNEYEKVDK